MLRHPLQRQTRGRRYMRVRKVIRNNPTHIARCQRHLLGLMCRREVGLRSIQERNPRGDQALGARGVIRPWGYKAFGACADIVSVLLPDHRRRRGCAGTEGCGNSARVRHCRRIGDGCVDGLLNGHNAKGTVREEYLRLGTTTTHGCSKGGVWRSDEL